MHSQVSLDAESAVTSGLFKVASTIIFAESVFRLSPPHAIVPVTRKSAEGKGNHHSERHGQEHVGHSVVYNKFLHQHGEGPRAVVAPHDSTSVDGASHNEVASLQVTEEISPGRSINHNWERGSLVRPIQASVSTSP